MVLSTCCRKSHSPARSSPPAQAQTPLATIDIKRWIQSKGTTERETLDGVAIGEKAGHQNPPSKKGSLRTLPAPGFIATMGGTLNPDHPNGAFPNLPPKGQLPRCNRWTWVCQDIQVQYQGLCTEKH
ncbi:hypothetical protein GWK47_054496 [Chionoecetes opilio]|uniref:Uncharacterized protein n=1 Tax=Chionoecetes opilio TaxID=41210 RepID=A0A8J5CRQ1_CHIOP|nr:hypothetical protein GWK47_054496 [Chionoecetes opilio]